MHLRDKQSRERRNDASAPFELLFRLLPDAVYKLEMVLYHPFRGSFFLKAAVEFEGRSDGDHHTVLQVWAEPVHEEFLLRGAERYPHDVGSVGVDGLGDRGIVELVGRAER